MLSIENLDIFYGGIRAVKNISFEVPQGKIVTLIGANGAGKTSTLRAISGLLEIKSGTIRLNKEKISGNEDTGIYYLSGHQNAGMCFLCRLNRPQV